MNEQSVSTETQPIQSFNQEKYDSLLAAAQSLAIVHNLLNQGLFQGQARTDLNKAIPYVEEFHKTIMAELEPMMELKEKLDSAEQTAPASEVQ